MSAERADAGDDELDRLVESFLALRRRGAAPTLEGFLAEHPRHADELRELLQAVLALGELEDERAPAGPAPARPPLERIGPYRITREIGRGGMGIVYEAVQLELGRRVALKVLPERRLARESDVARFAREAMLASRLDHPSICTVYESGRAEDAPYIAMRFVEGHSLAELIARSRRELRGGPASSVRLPEARGDSSVDRPSSTRALGGALRGELARVVRLVERVARGLHAAHEAGIVHRDVKPGNIMVDREGHPVILDFGMARLLDPGSDAVTRTGDVCGTPAYMSPEQISGKASAVERESDVYSLGVTLFECLTLHLPFEAPSREALYRAILVREAPDARSLNPLVPRDLAAILAQALEKSPARRYRTAQELADDLARFLELRPVHARPVGGLRRTLRAARRHPALTASIALAALLLFGTPTLIAVRQRLERERLDGERQRTHANFEGARDTIERLLAEIGDERLSDGPQDDPLRRRMLDEALGFYTRMRTLNAGDAGVRLESARACRRVGFIQHKLGRFPEAEAALREAEQELARLRELAPADDERLLELCQARVDLADLLLETNRPAEAEELLRRHLDGLRAGPELPAAAALAVPARLRLGQAQRQTGRLDEAQASLERALGELDGLDAARSAQRESRQALVQVLSELGDLQALRGQRRQAGARLERAVEIAEALQAAAPGDDLLLQRLGRARGNLARFFLATGRLAEAEAGYLAALAELEALVARQPGRISLRRALAELHNQLASVWMRDGRTEEARRGYQRTLELQQRVVEAAPEQAFSQGALARAFANLAFAEAASAPDAARRDYASAIAISDRLAREHPDQPGFLADAANDHDCLGSLFWDEQQPEDAEREYLAALALRRALAEAHPEVPDYQSDLGGLLHNYSRVLRGRGELEAAHALLEEAACLQQQALRANPDSPLYRDYLVNHREGLAETCLRLSRWSEARAQAEACVELLPGPLDEHVFAARFLARLAGLCGADDPALAEDAAHRALLELELSLGRGALRPEALARDAAFDALRGRAEFQRLAGDAAARR